MKRLLTGLLLTGIVGWGDARHIAALEKLGTECRRNEQGQVAGVGLTVNKITNAGPVAFSQAEQFVRRRCCNLPTEIR